MKPSGLMELKPNVPESNGSRMPHDPHKPMTPDEISAHLHSLADPVRAQHAVRYFKAEPSNLSQPKTPLG